MAEELAFGQACSHQEMRLALARWRLDDLPLDREMCALNRWEAVRLMLARADLGGCELLLMEQPDAGLSDRELVQLLGLLRSWLARSGALGIVTCCRDLSRGARCRESPRR